MNSTVHEDLEIRTAATRSILNHAKWLNVIMILLAIPVVAGVVVWIYQLINGLKVTNMTDQVFWGVYTANLVAFIGLSYGGALTSAILRLTGASWRAPVTRIAEATALVTLIIGAAFVFIHLGRPERVWQFLVRPHSSSPLVWDAIAISTYMMATIIFLYLPLIPDLAIAAKQKALSTWHRSLYRIMSLGWQGTPKERSMLERGMTVMAIIIIPIAVTVHSVLSWAFAVTTREGWHSTIFGPYFVTAALYSGIALVILAVLGFRKAYGLEKHIKPLHIKNLGYIMLTLGMVYLYFTFSELLTVGYPLTEKAAKFFEILLVHPYGPYFWLFIVAGGIIPISLIAFRKTRNLWGIGIAAALVVNMLWIKRLLIVVPAQATPLITGEVYFYWPSLVESILTIGGMCAIPLFLLIFFRIFPILSVTEMEEVKGSLAKGERALSATTE